MAPPYSFTHLQTTIISVAVLLEITTIQNENIQSQLYASKLYDIQQSIAVENSIYYRDSYSIYQLNAQQLKELPCYSSEHPIVTFKLWNQALCSLDTDGNIINTKNKQAIIKQPNCVDFDTGDSLNHISYISDKHLSIYDTREKYSQINIPCSATCLKKYIPYQYIVASNNNIVIYDLRIQKAVVSIPTNMNANIDCIEFSDYPKSTLAFIISIEQSCMGVCEIPLYDTNSCFDAKKKKKQMYIDAINQLDDYTPTDTVMHGLYTTSDLCDHAYLRGMQSIYKDGKLQIFASDSLGNFYLQSTTPKLERVAFEKARHINIIKQLENQFHTKRKRESAVNTGEEEPIILSPHDEVKLNNSIIPKYNLIKANSLLSIMKEEYKHVEQAEDAKHADIHYASVPPLLISPVKAVKSTTRPPIITKDVIDTLIMKWEN